MGCKSCGRCIAITMIVFGVLIAAGGIFSLVAPQFLDCKDLDDLVNDLNLCHDVKLHDGKNGYTLEICETFLDVIGDMDLLDGIELPDGASRDICETFLDDNGGIHFHNGTNRDICQNFMGVIGDIDLPNGVELSDGTTLAICETVLDSISVINFPELSDGKIQEICDTFIDDISGIDLPNGVELPDGTILEMCKTVLGAITITDSCGGLKSDFKNDTIGTIQIQNICETFMEWSETIGIAGTASGGALVLFGIIILCCLRSKPAPEVIYAPPVVSSPGYHDLRQQPYNSGYGHGGGRQNLYYQY